MSKLKKTPWFKRGTKPVRVGVYETLPSEGDRGTWYQYWNGTHWCFLGESPAAALQLKRDRSCFQYPRWRGLASNPSERG